MTYMSRPWPTFQPSGFDICRGHGPCFNLAGFDRRRNHGPRFNLAGFHICRDHGPRFNLAGFDICRNHFVTTVGHGSTKNLWRAMSPRWASCSSQIKTGLGPRKRNPKHRQVKKPSLSSCNCSAAIFWALSDPKDPAGLPGTLRFNGHLRVAGIDKVLRF